jgi:molybdopterin-guanine dinucleotide biosynthesis protein A
VILQNNIYGLVLSGGKSTRMGTDKGKLKYHGIPHRNYLYDLLSIKCERTFLSIRKSQQQEIDKEIDIIIDNDQYRGPFNGILSAHNSFPEVSWFVIACDLPFLDKETIQLLIKKRNPNKMATVYATNKSKLPEPLCAIWEPEGLIKAKEWLVNAQSSCPRKFLMNSDIELVFPENDDVLFNANSKTDYQQALTKL